MRTVYERHDGIMPELESHTISEPIAAKLTFIFPVFNEAGTVEQIVKALLDVPLVNIEKEIIIVNDASTDGTREILDQKLAAIASKIIHHPKNLGKGAAIHSGLAAATGNWVAIQDADLEYDPYDFVEMLKPMQSGKADVVFGSRYLFLSQRRVLNFWHSKANKLLTNFANALTNLHLTDVHACYKVFDRELLLSLNLQEKRFAFDPEVVAKLSKRNVRIYEVGISYAKRSYSEGKKIGVRDLFRALYVILRYRFFDPR